MLCVKLQCSRQQGELVSLFELSWHRILRLSGITGQGVSPFFEARRERLTAFQGLACKNMPGRRCGVAAVWLTRFGLAVSCFRSSGLPHGGTRPPCRQGTGSACGLVWGV